MHQHVQLILQGQPQLGACRAPKGPPHQLLAARAVAPLLLQHAHLNRLLLLAFLTRLLLHICLTWLLPVLLRPQWIMLHSVRSWLRLRIAWVLPLLLLLLGRIVLMLLLRSIQP